MPERLTRTRLKNQNILLEISSKQQPRSSSQNPRCGRSRTQLMAPANLACLVINRLDNAFAPEVIVGAGPAVGTVRGFGEVDAITGMSRHQEQPRLHIKTRRAEVRHSALIGRDQTPIGRRLLSWIGNRTPLLVDHERPVNRPKRDSE